jgi:hypothetical protein
VDETSVSRTEAARLDREACEIGLVVDKVLRDLKL